MRNFFGALASEFAGVRFTGISLSEPRPKKGREKNWSNIEIKFCGDKKPKLFRNSIFILKTLTETLKRKYTFLICSHVNLLPVALFLKKVLGLNYAVLTYGGECWNLKGGLKYRGLLEADTVITISEYTKGRMSANGIPADRIKLLPHAVDTSAFYRKKPRGDLRKNLALKNERILLTVAHASSEERYKGHDIMLEALKGLEGYAWLAIGGGDDLVRLKEKARMLGVFQRVRFLGAVPNAELIEYYNLCDVFVMPSAGEGFGVVFLEAMACGRPVVGGKRDGTRQPLMNGKLGFLVDPTSADDIRQAVCRASSAKEERTDPAYLRGQVGKNFSLSGFNERVREILSEKFA